MIIKEIKKHIANIEIVTIKNKKELIHFKNKFLNKEGVLQKYLKILKNNNNIKEKKNIGIYINKLKTTIIKKIKTTNFNDTEIDKSIESDITIPKYLSHIGSQHPVYIIENKIINILKNIGFILHQNTEIEDEWYNFTALNIPKNHPSRKLHDTFFLNYKHNKLLRTHTSSTQIRYMKKNTPPIRIISSGKVYRNETISKKSLCMFHQLEGFYIDKQVSIKDLMITIKYILNNIFNNKINIRFRDSYFPFTKPSIEVDIKNKKNTTWTEILGCGMISNQVFKNVGINNNIYSGFAFGIGIERITQIIYKIKDIRNLYKHDINILQQFINKF